MLEYIKSELKKLNIDLLSCISLDNCEITRPYLLEKKDIHSGSVILFAVPYLLGFDGEQNISSYAISRDYHLFFNSLFENLLNKLEEKYPNNKFAGFTDHSPINEISAAAKSGIGIIGQNRLLITEKYSSFVFLGEIITDAILDSNANEIKHCIDCGKCVSACPVNLDINRCLSSVTQKKAELTEEEVSLIKAHGCAWGCDICQNVCPYTRDALRNGTLYTEVDFFKNHRTPYLTAKIIEEMSDEEFKRRAYSWRGKKVIKRNLMILEEKEK